MFKYIFISGIAILFFSLISPPSLAQQQNEKVTIHASEMKFSRNVTKVEDHVVIWGLGRDRYAWVACPRARIPFPNFYIEVEVSADTAANRWPRMGIAFNDSSNLVDTVKTVTSLDWYELPFCNFKLGENDTIIYFVFTNDYVNRRKNQDLNLRIRNVTFHEISENERLVKLSWDANIEEDVAGYFICYGLSSGYNPDWYREDVKNVTEKTLKLATGWTYYFIVQAYDYATNVSAFSDEVSIYIPAHDVSINFSNRTNSKRFK